MSALQNTDQRAGSKQAYGTFGGCHKPYAMHIMHQMRYLQVEMRIVSFTTSLSHTYSHSHYLSFTLALTSAGLHW